MVRRIKVRQYNRHDGTKVRAHNRKLPFKQVSEQSIRILQNKLKAFEDEERRKGKPMPKGWLRKHNDEYKRLSDKQRKDLQDILQFDEFEVELICTDDKCFMKDMKAIKGTKTKKLKAHQSRINGIRGEATITKHFKKQGYQVENITHPSKGAGDLIVRKHNKPQYLIEVKRINLHEHNGRKSRIQVNRIEHRNMLKHANKIGVIPIYATIIKTPKQRDKVYYLSHDTVSKQLQNHKFNEVKLSQETIIKKGRKTI